MQACDMTCSHVWRDSIVHEPSSNTSTDPSYLWQDSCMYVTWHIYTCDVTSWYVWRYSIVHQPSSNTSTNPFRHTLTGATMASDGTGGRGNSEGWAGPLEIEWGVLDPFCSKKDWVQWEHAWLAYSLSPSRKKTHTRTYTYTYRHKHTHRETDTHTHTHAHTQTHTPHTHTHTRTHTNTHTHTQTHTHTHTERVKWVICLILK